MTLPAAPPSSDAALPQRWHTSTFRLLTAYSLLFSLTVVAILGVFMWRATAVMSDQIDRTLYWEAHYYVRLNASDIESAINRRVAQQQEHYRSSFFGVFDAHGAHLAGDIRTFPQNLRIDGVGHRVDPGLDVSDASSPRTRALAVRLPDSRVVVVARDVGPIKEFHDAIRDTLVWTGLLALVAGMGGGYVMSVRQFRRIHETQRVIEQIVNGNLDRRLPTGGRDELDMLAHLVNHMLERIGRLMAEVKGACDGVAHDLRTPLAHVRKTLSQAQHRAAQLSDPPDAELTGLIQYAEANTDALLERFRAMLRISEIESMRRRGEFDQFALRPLLADLEDLYRPLAEDKGIAFSSDIGETDDLVIHGDRALLFEALSNLLDNAIKFTKQGGVKLELSATQAGPRIEVRDTGIGIAESERDAVLQRFYRSEGSRHIAGSGLGLSIVSAVVGLHDFGLAIESANPGTRIRLDCWKRALV
ncbi:sensor histidine kinase [Pararobbsia silviterrae]|uniref:histidine kinase n=1 Tax=Pararobbsia silviterrae TaxID=1792498 RepID=A0A494XV93_9BURK|nr:sensor histidine kinase [Pararobbsia silviterrae]